MKIYKSIAILIFIMSAITFLLTDNVTAQEIGQDVDNVNIPIFLPIVTNSSSSPYIRNGADPNFEPSKELLDHRKAKDEALQQTVKAAYYKGSNYLSVGTWLEPNDYAHRNYCGPGAGQVALDAQLPNSQVPDIDTLGTEMSIDPNFGVYMHNVCPALNDRLGGSPYVYDVAANQSELTGWILANIDNGYATITGVKTGAMQGWGGENINHIVATYGYSNVYVETSGTYGNVNYIETSGSMAGYNGSYHVAAPLSSFWGYVSLNNAQCRW